MVYSFLNCHQPSRHAALQGHFCFPAGRFGLVVWLRVSFQVENDTQSCPWNVRSRVLGIPDMTCDLHVREGQIPKTNLVL